MREMSLELLCFWKKNLNNFPSAVFKLPTVTMDVTPSFRHFQQGQGSSGTFTSPGLYQAWICRQGCIRVETSKGSPSPEESEGPVILSNIYFKGSTVTTSSEERAHHWTAIGSLQQNKGKSWDFGWLELSGSRSLHSLSLQDHQCQSLQSDHAHPSFCLALANLHGNRSCQRVCSGVSHCWNLQLSFTAVSLII